MKRIAVIFAFSLCGCTTAIFVPESQAWRSLKTVKNVPCVVVGEDQKQYETKCTMYAGQYVATVK